LFFAVAVAVTVAFSFAIVVTAAIVVADNPLIIQIKKNTIGVFMKTGG